MRSIKHVAIVLVVLSPSLAAVLGWIAAPPLLHPIRRELTPEQSSRAQNIFAEIGAKCDESDVRAPDGILLRGWKVRPARPNGSWVLVFHGVADNRTGVVGQASILLTAGYSVVMMDARAQGASEGNMATYGWLERKDTSAILDALQTTEHPKHIFALGESMGAGIALQSAAYDPRIEAVVAEAPFASLREAAYDYAGLQHSPLLGMTLFAPGAWTMIWHGELLAGIPAAEVSPERAVAQRPFPVLLICDEADTTLPCRHAEKIYSAARGPKELWRVPGAPHTGALGTEPDEFRRRVLTFFERIRSSS
jgi:uncharacterized protein